MDAIISFEILERNPPIKDVLVSYTLAITGNVKLLSVKFLGTESSLLKGAGCLNIFVKSNYLNRWK